MTLREVLHAHIPTLTAQSTIRDAVDKMDIYQFPALVIVSDDLEPIAVVTEGDISRAASLQESLSAMATQNVMTIATKDPTVAAGGEEISDALHRMLGSGITILPVVDDGRLSGIVLRVDLMQAIFCDVVANS